LQHYDIGVEPSGIGAPSEVVNISWMGKPDYGARSLGRGQGPSLFQRTYEYQKDGQSLKGVPIQVWSMKTMTSRWQTALSQKQAGQGAVLEQNIQAERGLLHGSLQSLLPAKLVKCRLLYRDYVWELETLEPGQKVEVGDSPLQLKSVFDQQWGYTSVINQAKSSSAYENRNYFPGRQSPPRNLHDLLWRMMLFRKSGAKADEHNDYLDFLDQSWRLEFDKEAMLIGILEDAEGPSTEINRSNRMGCRLNPFVPDLRGDMKESTIVRIFFPVKIGED
jgi:hypothetical protein